MGAIAGPCVFGYGFKLRKRYRLIENIPTSKTRSVAMGLVEVCGTAESADGAYLTSPFACAPCVYYQYKIEEERGSGKHRHWATVASGQSVQPFLVKDDTGSVPVDPLGAELNLNADRSYQTGLFSSGDNEAFRMGLRRLALSTSVFGSTLRCKETFISAGDPIYVLGTAVGSAGAVVIAQGGRGDSFYLSDGSEKDLLGSLKTQALLCLYGGPALTVFCLYLLLQFYWTS